MRLRIVPYKLGSESAKLLAAKLTQTLGYKVWRGKEKVGRKILNFPWGQPGPNKIHAFRKFQEAGVPHVPFTTNKAEAQGWLRDGRIVFARTASGQGGAGITIVQPNNGELPDKPLYTQYIKKRKEFRVHVFNGEVIDVQEKRKRQGVEAGEGGLVRNLENGWVFCHENIAEPRGLRDAAIGAVRALGHQFGAVDIIWNEKQNAVFVLEVNTAPGLCETTAEKYANAIKRYIPNTQR